MIHQTAFSFQDKCIQNSFVHFQSVFVSKEVIKSPTWDETHYTLISTVCVPVSSQHATAQEHFHGLVMGDLMSPCYHAKHCGCIKMMQSSCIALWKCTDALDVSVFTLPKRQHEFKEVCQNMHVSLHCFAPCTTKHSIFKCF